MRMVLEPRRGWRRRGNRIGGDAGGRQNEQLGEQLRRVPKSKEYVGMKLEGEICRKYETEPLASRVGSAHGQFRHRRQARDNAKHATTGISVCVLRHDVQRPKMLGALLHAGGTAGEAGPEDARTRRRRRRRCRCRAARTGSGESALIVGGCCCWSQR